MEATISIVPRFTMDSVRCITGRYGPFTANFPIHVPLWLALHFRSTSTCTINAPAFLQLDYLRDMLERESLSEGSFEPLPYYFFEIAKLLIEHGAQDVPHVAEVTRLMGSISALRKRKLQRSMAVFESDEAPMFIPGIKLSNLVSHELHFLRQSFAVVLRQAYDMDRRRRGTEVLHRIGAGAGVARHGHGLAVAPAVTMMPPLSQSSQSHARPSSASLYSSRPSWNGPGSEMASSWTAPTTTTSGAAAMRDRDDLTSVTTSSMRETTQGSFSQTTGEGEGEGAAGSYEGHRMTTTTSASAISLDTWSSQAQPQTAQPMSLSQMSGTTTTTTTEMTWGAGMEEMRGPQQGHPFPPVSGSLQPPVKKRRTLRQT